MSGIIAKIDKTVEKYNMLCVGDTVVIGVSGGADSMLLLYYLMQRREELSLNLIAANVEHGIRGQESVDDTAFVEEYCKSNNVTFKCLRINAITEAEDAGLGVEEYSRNRRYDFFRSFNADKIATAHNLSDNVETLLFRLSRGTSIKGCCGIPAVRNNIVRPLIDCSGNEIRNACSELNIPYVIDSTNNDNLYSRNLIRNCIVPEFTKINSNFENNAFRFIESVKEDEECLSLLANACFDSAFKNNALMIDKLKKYHISLIKRAFIKYCSLYDITLDELHLNGLLRLLDTPSRLQIKGNYFAVSDKRRIRIALFEQTIDLDTARINKQIISRNEFLTNCELLTKKFAFYCDYDKIVGIFGIRPRDEGDSISPAGRGCSKSLKKLYNEYSIPVEDRENVPVIYDERGIIGIYGYCCDERVKIDSGTVNVLLLKISTEDSY